MRTRTLVLFASLVVLALAPPTASADPFGDDPCICDPLPCGNPPSIVSDPSGWADTTICNLLGGSPW